MTSHDKRIDVDRSDASLRAPIEPPPGRMLDEPLARLSEAIPGVVVEGRLDLTRLRETIGELVDDDQAERFTFSWAGKRAALQLLQATTYGALSPDRDEALQWETTRNVVVEGENLDVLKLLYKSYFGRVQAIYIDPPYNTGNDFIYPDDFADRLDAYLAVTRQVDDEGRLRTSNPETSGRFHSAWLSMMYPRLFMARQLLKDEGMIFVSIDDHEVDNLRLLMNEVFGEENRIEQFVWKRSYGGGAKERYAVTQHEYVLLYAKRKDLVAPLWLPPNPETERKYYKYRDDKYERLGPYRLQPLGAAKSLDARARLRYPIAHAELGEIWPDYQWLWERDRTQRALADDELVFTRKGDDVSVSYKQYLRDASGKVRGAKPTSLIDGIYTQHGTQEVTALFDGSQVMQYPKPVRLVKTLLSMATEPARGDIVLDFFAGSGTTAHATMELNAEDAGNRRFILVQLPEPTPDSSAAHRGGWTTIAALCRERVRRAAAQVEAAAGGNGLDAGVRTYRYEESSFRPWPPLDAEDVDAYVQQVMAHADQLAADANPEKVLWEIALREGLGLDAAVAAVEPTGTSNTVMHVADPVRDRAIFVCLDDEIDPAIARALGLATTDVLVCKERALSDTLAANLELQCQLKTA